MNSRLTIMNGEKVIESWRCICRSYQDFRDAESSGVLGKTMSLWRFLIPSNSKGAALQPIAVENEHLRDNGRADTGPLEFRDFNSPPSVRLFNPSLADTYHADVSAPSPFDFIWSMPGTPPVRIEDMTSAIFHKVLAWDLLVCKEQAHPFYHRIEQEIDDVVHRYLRLLLPVVDGQGVVCRIYAFCRPLATHETHE